MFSIFSKRRPNDDSASREAVARQKAVDKAVKQYFADRQVLEEKAINRDLTTKKIALSLLFTFIISVAALFAINIFWAYLPETHVHLDPEGKKAWFEMLKNGTILLGTALTTVIGYYFGQRGAVAVAEAKKEAQKEVASVEDKAARIVDDVEKDKERAIRESSNVQTSQPGATAPRATEDDASDITPII